MRPFTPRLGINLMSARADMQLSNEDQKKIGRGYYWAADVTDLNTGKRWRVKGADCSCPGCFCDAVIVYEIPAVRDLFD